ncbi:MAG: 50S ribosomal protein L25/general stress protein Ctc [Desulfobacterales bacterium]|nr:50S ribosomal protein L25/general stress protein Ctc [Desulfobacterales bacterium]
MEILELKTKVRTRTGNGPARTLRRDNQIPGVLYGPGIAPVSLSVYIKELEKVLKKREVSHVLLNLVIQNGTEYTKIAMIKELQTHPVSQQYLHVDFYEVALDRKIRVNVPVVTRGNAAGVALGGVVEIVRRELEILVFPNEIPDVIEVDITNLNIGDSVHLDEIPLSGDMEMVAESNFTVVTVSAPKAEETEEGEKEAQDQEEDTEPDEA